jgi:hypothetical protein
VSFKKGLVQPPPAAPATGVVKPLDTSNQRIGKSLAPKPQPAQPPKPEPKPLLFGADNRPLNVDVEPPRRGLIQTSAGQPVRGLQPQTIKDGEKARTPAANTQCTSCQEWFPLNETKTVVANAERSSNPLVLCVKCQQRNYRDPKRYAPTDSRSDWKPSVPDVRFDREHGRPYNAKKAGVSLGDLLNRDTYHRPEDDPTRRRE